MAGATGAQVTPGSKAASPAAGEAGGASPRTAIPDSFKINMLIRSTVIAVNQANKTANYTVLRDLAAPGFRVENSAEKLALIFENLRKTKFDLSPVMFFTPKLVQPPALMESGLLRLTGFFETKPQQVTFDLAFEHVQNDWLLYGINIGTRPAPVAPAGGAAN